MDARLQGARAPLSDLVRRRLDDVPVDRITGELAVGYDELARASGIAGLKIAPEGDRLRVSGSVLVFGQRVDASAVGRVTVANGDIVVTAEQAEVAGVALPKAALDAAAGLLSFRVSPRRLPLSLRVTGVRVAPDRLHIAAEGDHVVLRRGALPVG